MRSLYAVVLVAAILVSAHAFPGAKRDSTERDEDSTEVRERAGSRVELPKISSLLDDLLRTLRDGSSEDDSPIRGLPGFGGADDDDEEFEGADDKSSSGSGICCDLPQFGSYDFSVPSLKEITERLRAQMAAALAGFKVGSLTPWGSIPEGANTTSTTKIIGGHAVTINETTYSNGDENGKTIFRVRVVDVKPANETEEGDVILTPTNNNESAEDPEEDVQPPTRTQVATDDNSNAGSSSSTSTGASNNNSNESASNEEEDNKREETTPNSNPTRSVETVEEFNNEIPKSQVETLTA